MEITNRDAIGLRWLYNISAIILHGGHEPLIPRFLLDAKALDEARRYGGSSRSSLQPSTRPIGTGRSNRPIRLPTQQHHATAGGGNCAQRSLNARSAWS
jgi:hypothetical protein